MCICKMIGGCVDGMDYELPDGHDGCVVIERAPGHLNEPVKYHSYRIVEMYDGIHVGVCEAISLEKPLMVDSIIGTPRPEYDLDEWFELSYASFLTLPRVLMNAMSGRWRKTMAMLLQEYDEAYPNRPHIGTRVQATKHGKLIKMPAWLKNYRYPDYAKIDELRG